MSQYTLITDNVQAVATLRLLADYIESGELQVDRMGIELGESIVTPLELELLRVLPLGQVSFLLQGQVDTAAQSATPPPPE